MSSLGAQKTSGRGQHAGKKHRVLLIDDHPLVLEGLASVINQETDLTVCGQASSIHAGLEAVENLKPELVLLDLGFGNHNLPGFDLIKDIHTRHPKIKMMVVSMHGAGLHAERAIRAGASGYITKDEATIKIVDAIRQVLKGDVYVSRTLMAQMLSKFTGQPASPTRESILERLTDRELQIFYLIGDGVGRVDIAKQLKLDVNTIETYRSRIREKLDLKNAAELLQFAIKYRRIEK